MQLRLGGGGDRLRTDRRHVEAQILAALGRLDEYACRPGETQAARGAQLGDARQHRVGPLGRLDRDDAAAGDDDPLSGVEGRQRGDQRRADADVGLGLRRRGALADRAERREQLRRDLMGANDVEAFALEDRGDAGKQAVVAAAKRLRELWQALDRAPIEAQVGELGPGQAADQRDVGDALGAQD